MADFKKPRTGPPSDRDQQRLARRKLAQLDRMEDFAVEYENFEQVYGHEVPANRLSTLRDLFATRYKRLAGVHPRCRSILRSHLEPVAETGCGDVGKIIENINNTLYEKGFFDE